MESHTVVAAEEAAEFDKERWQIELQAACPALKHCQFPACTEIEIGGTKERATISMTEKGLSGNMQSDAAAFEAWALTLLVHCGAKSVHIRPGPVVLGQHYQRFLYRLERFRDLFPGCVTAERPSTAAEALNSQVRRFLNQPNPRRERPGASARTRMEAACGKSCSESDLEKALEISAAFRSRFQLEKVMRQWPVGLFKERVAKRHEIFTGRKSAIDLIGIRGDTLVLFELKKGDNRKAGALSELLFYASVMRDAIGEPPLFEFESVGAKTNCSIGPGDITGRSRICAVLLAPEFHPLIGERRLLAALNAAAAQCFGADRPVCFEAAKIAGYPANECEDFRFEDGPIHV